MERVSFQVGYAKQAPFFVGTIEEAKTLKEMQERYGLSEADVCGYCMDTLTIRGRQPLKGLFEKAAKEGTPLTAADYQQALDSWKPGVRTASSGVSLAAEFERWLDQAENAEIKKAFIAEAMATTFDAARAKFIGVYKEFKAAQKAAENGTEDTAEA
jgi:hypothetical protein